MYYSLYNINLIWITEEPGCIGGRVPFGLETGAIVYYFVKFHEYQIIKKGSSGILPLLAFVCWHIFYPCIF